MNAAQSEITYEIDNHSSMFIAGTTNVNTFDCFSKDRFTKATARVTFDEGNKALLFDNAAIALRTASLDCDNERMNEDLRAVMMADKYPFIHVSLQSAKIIVGSTENIGESATLVAEAFFTITHVKRKVKLNVVAKREAADTYRFSSSASVKMTDYGIEPPSAMLGLIKVRDNITINFNLLMRTVDTE